MWLFLTLTAATFWALTNATDKYLISKRNLNPFFILFILCWMDFLIGLIFFLIFNDGWTIKLLYGLGLGMLIPLTDFLYYKSLKEEEVSRIMPWFELSVIFIAVGGAVFLGEILNFRQYLGILILLFGLWLITIKDRPTIRFDRWVWLIVVASISVTVINLTEKYLLNDINPFRLFGVVGIGSLIGFVPFWFWQWPVIKTGLKEKLSSVKFMALSEFFGLTAILLSILALSYGLVTLVSAFMSFQYLFLLLIATLISVFKPSIIEEVVNKKTVSLKIMATIMVIVAIYLINV